MGKRKGSSYERAICRRISLWWSGGEFDDLCWRSASSGARGTVSRSGVKGYHGDLAPVSPSIEPLFNIFSFEVKHYREIDVSEVLRDCQSKILDWYKQSLRSAFYSKRFPLVICKPNNLDALLVCSSDLVIFNPELRIKGLRYISVGGRLRIMNFDNVLDRLDIHIFKAWLENEAKSWLRVYFPGVRGADINRVKKAAD